MSFTIRLATFAMPLSMYESTAADVHGVGNLRPDAYSVRSARDALHHAIDEQQEKVERLQEELAEANDDAGRLWGVFSSFVGDDSGVGETVLAGEWARLGAGAEQPSHSGVETYKRGIA